MLTLPALEDAIHLCPETLLAQEVDYLRQCYRTEYGEILHFYNGGRLWIKGAIYRLTQSLEHLGTAKTDLIATLEKPFSGKIAIHATNTPPQDLLTPQDVAYVPAGAEYTIKIEGAPFRDFCISLTSIPNAPTQLWQPDRSYII